jgi:ribosomal protein L19E
MPYEIEENITTDDVAELIAYFNIKNKDQEAMAKKARMRGRRAPSPRR